MLNAFQRLLTVLSGASDADLRRQIQYLKAENEILRSKLPRVVGTNPAERARLVRLGRVLGPALGALLSIVSPRTFRRWVSEARGKHRARTPPTSPGRPRTGAQIRAIVLRLARETDFGYMRIEGELLKLGIKISRSSIANILREHRRPTAPERGEYTWDQYIARHAKTLWACDFAIKKVWTKRGLVDAFVLVFIHIASRRVHMSQSTTTPDAAWVAEQARVFAQAARATGHRCGLLLRDGDTKFGRAFDEPLRLAGAKPHRLPFRSPNLNAFCERFIQTLQRECLDHFAVLGTTHLDYLVGEYADYYNRQRPHSAIDFRAPAGPAPEPTAQPPDPRDVCCVMRLGGLIKHYQRRAA